MDRQSLRNSNSASAGGHLRSELSSALRDQAAALLAVGFFSALVNVLLLTSPLYMLQVYDRVLASRSEATLIALSLIVAFLFVVLGVIDHVRGRVLARVGAKLQDALDGRVFEASARRLVTHPTDMSALSAQKDLEAVKSFWAAPASCALFDLPFAPLFLVALFIFHPVMGWFAVVAGTVLVLVTVTGHWLNHKASARAINLGMRSDRAADQVKTEPETLVSMGMMGPAFRRWMTLRSAALDDGLRAADVAGKFGSIVKTMRMLMQSAILGIAAWLVLRGELSGGAMIAGSILMGRALQPVEQLIGQWSLVVRAREGRTRLDQLLSQMPVQQARTELPRPQALLEVDSLSLLPPGDNQPVLRLISFAVGPGQAIGVIGTSGAGKSSLARAITGVWSVAGGTIRLGGATLDQYDPDKLGSYIGYLPQRVALFEGTIAENIARLSDAPDSEKIVEAAKRAAVHDMIVHLPQGYDTRISAIGTRLSGGQIQRIGLARALYGNPLLLVLDEPNSNLDNEGSAAVNAAIRSHKASGGAVLIMAHRPAAIQECDLLLVLEKGMRRAFGPRDDVLREVLKNSADLVAQRPGGVA